MFQILTLKLILCGLIYRQQYCGPFRIGANYLVSCIIRFILKSFLNVFKSWLPYWPNFLLQNSLPLQPHRPNDLSQCNVKHKGVEEPIYRCCTLYALRPRCNISGYLMSLLKRCDYFTSNKTCFIT